MCMYVCVYVCVCMSARVCLRVYVCGALCLSLARLWYTRNNYVAVRHAGGLDVKSAPDLEFSMVGGMGALEEVTIISMIPNLVTCLLRLTPRLA